MQRSTQRHRQSGVFTVLAGRVAPRCVSGAGWLLLLLGCALALAPQLGCHLPQTADGAGGQSGDEGRRGPTPGAPNAHAGH